MRKILNPSVGIDDFGNTLYQCHFTKKLVSTENSIFLGAVVPQVKGSYVCSPDALEFRKISIKAFNEVDANCNTCKNLERLPHEKQHPAAPHKGNCKLHPYATKVTFHPDDWMGMVCWQTR
jgi:hypothetical protein